MLAETKDHKNTIEVHQSICVQIYDILQEHKGKENAIPARCISQKLHLPLESSQVVCRTYIAKTIDMFQVPIIACSKGYFIATRPEEIAEYVEHLNARIAGIQITAEKAQSYFYKN